jgi:hypothetical protein
MVRKGLATIVMGTVIACSNLLSCVSPEYSSKNDKPKIELTSEASGNSRNVRSKNELTNLLDNARESLANKDFPQFLVTQEKLERLYGKIESNIELNFSAGLEMSLHHQISENYSAHLSARNKLGECTNDQQALDEIKPLVEEVKYFCKTFLRRQDNFCLLTTIVDKDQIDLISGGKMRIEDTDYYEFAYFPNSDMFMIIYANDQLKYFTLDENGGVIDSSNGTADINEAGFIFWDIGSDGLNCKDDVKLNVLRSYDHQSLEYINPNEEYLEGLKHLVGTLKERYPAHFDD